MTSQPSKKTYNAPSLVQRGKFARTTAGSQLVYREWVGHSNVIKPGP
uniref:Lariatin n=1 Tax=Rhodococcus jostii TaxID=132919 RepID=LARIA_RHOJO|nr:RecName: Full=Lariatin; AltName: Full=Class II lasso peptide; AltName: Full=Lariat peptide; AltName: Full=Ribosomally synthesized and post-translationally modified peptide; Short=RiPP; Contains: RecName: Full=Lariatin-A; Contains: RecName: Full=Lariatin-B [Rhodococcus jostii]BAL72546.1 lariatin precursor protein [Rhodococcus jostii]